MVSSAIILAGGLGTRLRSLVSDTPKPMALIAGKPFLERQMDYWIKQGIGRFILSVGYRYEDIQSYFGSNYRGAKLEYVIEKTPLGTGGGFLMAAQALDQNLPFLLLNGDTYFEVNLYTLNNFALANRADICFSVFESSDAVRYMGLELGSDDGKLLSLKSVKPSIKSLVNGGVYWINPKSLPKLEFNVGQAYSLEEQIFPKMLNQGLAIYGLEFDVPFIDIGVPADFLRAQETIIPRD